MKLSWEESVLRRWLLALTGQITRRFVTCWGAVGWTVGVPLRMFTTSGCCCCRCFFLYCAPQVNRWRRPRNKRQLKWRSSSSSNTIKLSIRCVTSSCGRLQVESRPNDFRSSAAWAAPLSLAVLPTNGIYTSYRFAWLVCVFVLRRSERGGRSRGWATICTQIGAGLRGRGVVTIVGGELKSYMCTF